MHRRRLIGILCVLAALALGPGGAGAQEHLPFSAFQSRSPEQLASLQVRLTYVGPARRAFPSLALSLPGDTLDANLLRTYRRADFQYPSAAPRLIVCPISPAELKAALDSVAGLPDVVDGGLDSLALFSFALVDTSGGRVRCFESILNETSGLELASHMGEALRGNPRASAALSAIACGLRVESSRPADEVTRLVGVTLAGLSSDTASRRVTAKLRLVNLSRDTIPGPLVVVLSTSPETVRLLDADGYTCRVFHPGTPFVVVPLDRPLAPRAMVDRELRFDNPRQASFSVARRVFVGLADR